MSFSTAIKKALAAAALTAVLAPALRAQSWRADAAKMIGEEKKYAEAGRALAGRYEGLEATDKADAAALLAYCAAKTGDASAETRWIVEYFDARAAADGGFAFLDLLTQSDVIAFLNGWRATYPMINGIFLIRGIGSEAIVPEGILPLVVDITNQALYKFSAEGAVVKAGVLTAGFNIIALDANTLLMSSGRHTYGLEVKAGKLVLRREIVLDISVSSTRPKPAPVAESILSRPLSYTLSLYINGSRVLVSQKSISAVSFKLDVNPNKNPFGFKPDYMLNRDKPDPMNSVSLLNVAAMLVSLLTDLFKKKDKKDVERPRIQTVQDMTIIFPFRDSNGLDYETQVSLALSTRSLPYAVRGP